MKKYLFSIFFIGLIQALAPHGYAQDDYSSDESVGSESGGEESLYRNEADALMESRFEKRNQTPKVNEAAKSEVEKIESLSDLDSLAPFSDVAVIQKRFLPKSKRFEFNPNLGLITNNAFFMTTFAQGRLAYAFTEKWAVEFTLAMFMDKEYKVTEDLKDDANVATKSLLLPESYYGADIRWSPIYGKMGSFKEGIVPFDMYFSIGGGIMSTNQDTTPFAIHAGTGQIFALNKWMAFRWDLSGYFYSSEVSSAGGGGKNTQTFTDIHLGIGMSFFFPDATYR